MGTTTYFESDTAFLTSNLKIKDRTYLLKVIYKYNATHPSLSTARKKKKFKTKALRHVFKWCMDTLNPENEKNSTSLF